MGVILVLAWLGVAWHVLYPPSTSLGGPTPKGAPVREGDDWMGLYLGDKKMGYLHSRWRRRSPAGWRADIWMNLAIKALGQAHRTKMHMSADLDDRMVLSSFSMEMKGTGAGDMVISGKSTSPTDMEITFESPNGVRHKRIHLESPPVIEDTILPRLASEGFQVGKVYRTSYFDPMTQTNIPMEVEVLRRDELVVLGKPVQCFVVETRDQNQRGKAWVTEDGDVVKHKLPMGLVAIKETEDQAKYGYAGMADRDMVDLTEKLAVDAVGKVELLTDEKYETIEYELVGFSAEDLATHGTYVDGGRQRVRGRVVRVQPEPDGFTDALDRLPPWSPAAKPLAPEPLLQSDAPEIRAKAMEIVSGPPHVPSIYLAAIKIVVWVHQHMEKTSVVGVPSALDVLGSMKGDCNEHATLAVALMRSVGIPAEVVGGVALLPETMKFYYHAWVLVHLGDHLDVEMDPTFGEPVASTRRIRMVKGNLEDQAAIFKFMGRLEEIRVLGGEPASRGGASPSSELPPTATPWLPPLADEPYRGEP